MCGWSRLATASASAWKRCTSASEASRAGQDHLEGDEAVEADLPGLVDDAHAAAGDLLQHFVVAEVAQPRRGVGGRRGRGGWACRRPGRRSVRRGPGRGIAPGTRRPYNSRLGRGDNRSPAGPVRAQHRMLRFLPTVESVLNARRRPGLPGRLEAVARLVNATLQRQRKRVGQRRGRCTHDQPPLAKTR